MKSVTFTAAELVWRAQEKCNDPDNKFCYNDYDAALDDAMLGMKQELEGLRETVEIALRDPSVLPMPDYPDWHLLAERVK